LRSGDVGKAYQLESESLDLLRAIGSWAWGENSRLRTLAEVASQLGWHKRADEHGREALRLARESGDRIKTVIALASLALVAFRAGAADRAGRLWGAVEAEEDRSFLGWWTTYRDRYDEVATATGDPDFEQAREAGRHATLDDVIDEALARPLVVG
jgi:hypothetical protein